MTVKVPEYRIDGCELVQTCGACPEQYDVFRDGKQVGYLRLRHGYFLAEAPDVGGDCVYETTTIGDGSFLNEEERIRHLTAAVKAVVSWQEKNS